VTTTQVDALPRLGNSVPMLERISPSIRSGAAGGNRRLDTGMARKSYVIRGIDDNRCSPHTANQPLTANHLLPTAKRCQRLQQRSSREECNGEGCYNSRLFFVFLFLSVVRLYVNLLLVSHLTAK